MGGWIVLASFSTAVATGISGTVSGTIDQYAGGTASSQNLTGTYALAGASGRLGITGANAATSPICYLTNPFDGISAFCIATDSSAGLGVLDAQPAAPYSSSSLSGTLLPKQKLHENELLLYSAAGWAYERPHQMEESVQRTQEDIPSARCIKSRQGTWD